VIRFKIDIEGREFERGFDSDRIAIGREAGNDLVLEDASVSGHHCRVERAEHGWRVIGGEGETRLNGVAVRERRLCHKDRLDLGAVTLTFIDEAEAAALRPDEPLAVPDERPAYVMPDTLGLKPLEPAGDAAKPIPAAAPSEAVPTKTCPYCGHDIPEAATICRYCEEPLDARARRRQKKRAGDWSLLSARASATRGVSFRQMVEWVADGTVNENSSVSGPTTEFQWRFACETPRLSKYLGVCYQCGSPVKSSDAVCAACRVNLDGPAEGELQRTEATTKRRAHLLRIAAAVSFVLAAVLGAGYLMAFTPVGRWVLTESAQKQMRAAIEGLLVRPGQRSDPFAEDRGRMRQAEALCLRGDFEGALSIYNDLRTRLANTGLAAEIDAAVAFTKRCQKAHTERLMGDALMAAGRLEAALNRYLTVKERYGDTPAAEGIDEKISAARARPEGG